MQLTKWDPFREIEDVFDRYSKGLSWPRFGSKEIMTRGDWAPRVDIVETEKEFIIKAEIPDVKKEEVKITVDNGVLSIKGERKQEKEEKDENFHRVERTYGRFRRMVELPGEVDPEDIDASYKKGVLTMVCKKIRETEAKKIDIKTG